MAEYIKRENLMNGILEEKRFVFQMEDLLNQEIVVKTVYKDLFDFIKSIPAADVAPVRHCQWVLVEKGPDRGIYRCPWCGRIMATMFVESEVAKQFPYCHCGAKMDRGE